MISNHIARRSREPKAAEAAGRLRLCKNVEDIFAIIELKRTLITKFNTRFQRFNWMIGTFHVYKKGKRCNISFISDNLRKQGFDKIFITRERNEDHNYHYHFIVGYLKKENPFGKKVQRIKHHTLWVKDFSLDAYISYHDPEMENGDDYFLPGYTCISDKINLLSLSVQNLDLGFKHRWIQYGIVRYLLYIMKYFNKETTLYVDYFIK